MTDEEDIGTTFVHNKTVQKKCALENAILDREFLKSRDNAISDVKQLMTIISKLNVAIGIKGQFQCCHKKYYKQYIVTLDTK